MTIPEEFSAEEFITEKLGLSIIRLLGSGWHGSVYEIAAPTPQGIKVTADFTEVQCVKDLVKHGITSSRRKAPSFGWGM